MAGLILTKLYGLQSTCWQQKSTSKGGYFRIKRPGFGVYCEFWLKAMATKGKPKFSVLQIGYYSSLLETRSSILEREGYKVTSALGNKRGMAAATKERFDVAVVAFSGVVSDRIQMVRWLKREVPSTPVVAMLANAGEKFADADMVTFSENPRDLLSTIRQACAKK